MNTILAQQLGERELALWRPLWDSLLTLCEMSGGTVEDEEQLAVCQTANGAVRVTAGMVRELRQGHAS